jgi:membrane-bound ClpP family serine protease
MINYIPFFGFNGNNYIQIFLTIAGYVIIVLQLFFT